MRDDAPAPDPRPGAGWRHRQEDETSAGATLEDVAASAPAVEIADEEALPAPGAGGPRLLALLTGVVLAALVSCSGSSAFTVPASSPVAAVQGAPAPTAAALGLPDVVGLSLLEAQARLEAVGAGAQVVAFDMTSAVTAQDPPAGAPVPEGLVTLFQGTAPDPAEVLLAQASQSPAAPAPAPAAPVGDDVALPPTPGPSRVDPALLDGGVRSGEPRLLAEDDASLAANTDIPQRGPAEGPGLAAVPAAPTGTALQGPASWYGPGFEGRPMVCGGTFDPLVPVVVTRELPCGTQVYVHGPYGYSVAATVTDYGPADWTGRRFDLSYGAFAAVAPPTVGLIDVVVEVR